MLRHRNLIALATASGLLAACSSSGTVLTTVPPTSSSSSSSSTVVVPSSTEAGTTVAVSSTSTTVAPGIELSADGPWKRVDGAPGITTPGLFYELMPKLWVYLPTQEDIAHRILWTFREQDRPIIEAYLQARLVYFKAVTQRPMDLAAPGWTKWYSDGGASFLTPLAPRQQVGQIADLDAGVVLRPEVIGDERTDTTAIVFDCMLDGGVFRMPDGSLATGSSNGVAPLGLGFRMSVVSGAWKMGTFGSQPEACQ
jgi:hypothetical protein